MGKTIHQIWFKHLTGCSKRIPGVLNLQDLSPKMNHVVEYVQGVRKPMLRQDMDYVVKLTLLDEELDLALTEKEQKLAPRVQEAILARRSQEVDQIMQANERIRDGVRHYERSGDLLVLDYDKEVDVESLDARESISAELSPVAIADFESRGITIPDSLKRVGKAVANKGGISVHETTK